MTYIYVLKDHKIMCLYNEANITSLIETTILHNEIIDNISKSH